MGWQQLRATTALLIEWVRFLCRPRGRLEVVETESQIVRYRISRRRARLGLVGGGITAAVDDIGPPAREPVRAPAT